MTQSFDAAIAAFAPALPMGVGLSGGADSVALLLACHRRWPGQVHALHVHHGLQAAADGFLTHCQQLCESLGIPLRATQVDARNARGDSPEDAARRARYRALHLLAQSDGATPPLRSIAIAQHADDQVETVLLALSRGAGMPGLAAMPQHWSLGGMDWHRPLLRVAGGDVRAWLAEQGAPWVEDPTNADERFTRNRIRRHLLPALQAVFAGSFRDTFARSASHAAQAAELLHDLAAQDLAATGTPPRIASLQSLSRARQANLLRYWLRQHHGATPQAAQLDELLDQIAACRTRGHRMHIKVGAGFAVREGDVLGWYN